MFPLNVDANIEEVRAEILNSYCHWRMQNDSSLFYAACTDGAVRSSIVDAERIACNAELVKRIRERKRERKKGTK